MKAMRADGPDVNITTWAYRRGGFGAGAGVAGVGTVARVGLAGGRDQAAEGAFRAACEKLGVAPLLLEHLGDDRYVGLTVAEEATA